MIRRTIFQTLSAAMLPRPVLAAAMPIPPSHRSLYRHPPVAALFWIDPVDPEAGGTGHIIRACRLAGVPLVFRNHWETWLPPSF